MKSYRRKYEKEHKETYDEIRKKCEYCHGDLLLKGLFQNGAMYYCLSCERLYFFPYMQEPVAVP